MYNTLKAGTTVHIADFETKDIYGSLRNIVIEYVRKFEIRPSFIILPIKHSRDLFDYLMANGGIGAVTSTMFIEGVRTIVASGVKENEIIIC